GAPPPRDLSPAHDLTPTVAFCAYDKPGFLGGTSTWIQWLLPDLQAKGLKVRCYVFLHTGEKGPVTEYLESHGVECITEPAHYYTEDRVRWLLDKLSEDHFDVFVPNEVPAAYHAARWVKAAGIPTVGVLHVDGVASDIMQSLFVTGPRSDALTAIVCVSEHIEATVRQNESDGIAIHRIPCGADVPAERVRPSEDGLRMAYVGRLAEEQKRISLVAIALCSAVKEIRGVDAVLYGDGPQRAEVEEIIAREGSGLPIRLGGMLHQSQLKAALLDIHVIVLLSDYEGLPVALMEAMACGCVPVCLRISSGVPELVIDGVTGLLVDDRGESFVAAIRKLRADPALLSRLSVAARRHIENGYSHDAASTAWAELLRDVAKDARPSQIRVPGRIRIPPAIPPYETLKSRKPYVSPVTTLYRTLRMNLGRVRHRLMPGRSVRP
ncbi:MAG: glycosyltransferase family 4 protein, partial [Gemmatimonadales bacterium]